MQSIILTGNKLKRLEIVRSLANQAKLKRPRENPWPRLLFNYKGYKLFQHNHPFGGSVISSPHHTEVYTFGKTVKVHRMCTDGKFL